MGQGSYYYDYDSSEQCFLFRNLLQMECLIPKRGFLFYQNNLIISEDECNQKTSIFNSFHIIDPSAQECIDTRLSPYCTLLDDISQNFTCIKCKYEGQDPSKNCECPLGTFFNNQILSCQKCSPKCQTCKNTFDNCIKCANNDQDPPSCLCNKQNQYLDENFSCQVCSYKCNSCIQYSNYCLECSKDRVDPPYCNCKQQFNEVNNTCQEIKCDKKCLTCNQFSSNCVLCNHGRENPPKCNCQPNLVGNLDGTCTQCNQGQYFDVQAQHCEQCSIQCLQCENSKANCTTCKSSLFLYNNQCLCSSGTSLVMINNKLLCLKNMDVNFKISLKSDHYVLIFTFDHDIQQINSQYQQQISQLISLSFQEIPSNLYSISNPIIKGKQLQVDLNVKTNFYTQKGWVQFLDNTQFISTSEQFILDQVYTKRLINFQIGLVFEKQNLDGGATDQVINQFKNSNQDLLYLVKYFQVVLYILNTAQPTVLFLLLNAKLPPNLYKFYQMIGMLVYPNVVDYQSTDFKEEFQLYYMDLNQTEVYQSNELVYKKLGLCNSFLINAQGVIITEQMFITPCFENLDPRNQYVLPGDILFQSHPISSIRNFEVSFWFFLKGRLNQNYNIVTVLENNLFLFQITYNMFAQNFGIALLSNSPEYINTIQLEQKWYYSRFKLEVQLNLEVKLYSKIFYNGQVYIQKTHSSIERINSLFITKKLAFDFGNGQSHTQFSCLILQMAYIYLDSNFLDSSQFDLFDNLSSFGMLLKWNYDTFYNLSNEGYLIQNNNPNGKLPIKTSSKQQFILKNQETFATDFINYKLNKGFLITFHFKLVSQSGISNNFIIMKLNNYPVFKIYINNNQLYFINVQINGFQQNRWNQITVIQRQNLDSFAYVILNDDQSTLIKQNFGLQIMQYTQVVFGDSTSANYDLYLNYIRIYEGTFISQTSICFMLAARKDQHCIICKSGYLIDYQNNMACVLPSSQNQSTQIDNVKDWFPKKFVCPKNMILNSENVCVCIYQFYRSGEDCYQCKDYCQGCTEEEEKCIIQDPMRLKNGSCNLGYFDDGYSCIKPQFNIISRINYQINLFPIKSTGCQQQNTPNQYITQNSILQIQKGKGIFFSFQFTDQSNGSDSQATLALLKDGAIDLFTIIFQLTTQNGLTVPSINLYAFNTKLQTSLVNTGSNLLIGLWTDFTNARFYVYYDYIPLEDILIDVSSYFSSYPLNSPSFCIGKCVSLLQPISLCAAYSQILYIYNLDQPLAQLQIQNIKMLNTIEISFFQYDFFNLLESQEIVDPVTQFKLNSDQILVAKRFKGIKFTENNFAQIKDIDVQNEQPTFSCYIYLESLSIQQQIFSIQNSQYLIIPQGTKAAIRICKAFSCTDTKYAMLNLYKQNFLIIIYRNRGLYGLNEIQEYEIFCNYQREIIKFTAQQVIYPNPITANIFKSDTTLRVQIQTIYLNKIRLEVGNGSYYYDQNPQETCFLFRNILQMECLIPKKGYFFYKKNAIISEDQCNKMTHIGDSFHIVDYSSQECIDTGLSPYCTQIDEISKQVKCLKCKYPGQDPSLNCECVSKFFFNKQTLQCEACSPNCLACMYTFDNCLKCLQSDQSLPTCQCKDTNYFLNENYQCQVCSYKCNTCSQHASNCLTCSNNRENPPYCSCQQQFKEVNDKCQEINCDLKCLTCSQQSSNCVYCKNGRKDPPNCECQDGFVENSDGSCSQCNQGYYYELKTKSCQQCSIQCVQCVNQSSNCTVCKSGLIQKKNECQCNSEKSLAMLNNQLICLKNMDVNLKVTLNTDHYVLVFTFDYDIQEISSLHTQDISQLISINFQEIPKQFYDLSDPVINGKILTIKLNVNESFQTQQGWVQFLDNTKFISPFIFEKRILESGSIDKIINQFKNTNTDLFNFIKYFQVVLYILNTAQPNALFLLLNENLPPNLYKFYQIVGLFVYPDVVDYQSTNFKDDFSLYYMDLDQKEVYQSSELVYKKLGFCNSFLINAQGGTNIFQSYSNPTITKFAITGWFIMKGMLNQQYNMITVYENQSTLLFSISYNINQNTFTSQLLSGASQNLNYISGGVYPLQQKWYFARFKMEIILGTQVNLYSNIYESQSSYFYLQQNTAIRNSIPIQTSGMVFDFGKGISQQSCTLIKLVYVYWESDLLDTSMFGLINDVTVSNINLKCIYDTFYTKNNPEYLVQVNQPNGKSQIPINRSEQLTLKDQEQIYTESINVSSNGGFVLTFHFKIESQSSSANQIIIMQINNVNLMAQNNQLYFYNNLISGVQLNKWNQITIVYRQLFYNQINFIVNDDQATYRSFSLGSYVYQFVQAIFGDSTITDYFLHLNYIRIYEGLFLSNSPSCYMLAARQNQSCVICKSSYLIDYQNGINCVSPSGTNKSTIIDNVKDWFPKQVECPKNMILNNQNICVCMYNFYRNGDDCLPCQSYCQGCLDASTCIQKDPQRDSSGQCPNNQFDDGFQCLVSVFNLKNRKNILKTFPVNDFGSACTNIGAQPDYIIPQSQLNLSKGVGFFFSFSVKIYTTITQGTIAVLKDGGNDLFTITFDQNVVNGQALTCINFYALNNQLFQVNLSSYDEVWIGLYNTFLKAYFFVYTDQILYQNQYNVASLFSSITLNSPNLCVGRCTSQQKSSYVCAKYSQVFITLRFTFQDIYQIQNLMQQQNKEIALFLVDFYILPTSNTITDFISSKVLKLNLNYSLNRYKGAQFTQNIKNAYIQNISIMENIPTISFYIFIENLSQQKLIVFIQLTSTENIQYFIVPYGNKFLVRICYSIVCQDTQYAMLNFNQQNFLYIIQRTRQKSYTNIILEFEIFCNYQRENMEFVIQQQTYLTLTNIKVFPNESSLYIQDYSIYLNKIRFEVGNGSYYYDQNKSDNCFLYRNVSDMECMIPKQGYVFYQNNLLITEDACKQRTQQFNSFHVVNHSTQTCVDTQLSHYCQQVDEIKQNLVCSKCQYPGQIPIKNCQCDDGQFFNNQDLVCQNCSPRCKACVNQYDNCLSCYQIDQNPPNCDCNLSNYFVNKNNQCQACSYKCSNCKTSSEFCLACSNNRIDPPGCYCMDNYIEINNQCQIQTCDLKCLTCHSLTSNCVTCKNGRENPPICNCKTNFIENIDGTCTLCKFGDYYDKSTKSCQQCDIECLGCTEQASNCLACRSSLIQTKNKCSCQSGTSLAKIKNEYLCLKNMDVRLTISLQSNSYILLFKFDEDIQQLDSKYLQNIESLIKVTFSEISLNAYKIGNPIINKNTLSVQLIVNTSFSTKQGWVLFLDNTQFISVSEQSVLNKIYTVNLINFQIGPFVFDRNILDAGQLDKINDYYKNTNQDIFNLLKQFQIILYLLNSAQPTILFLLLDAKLPPNLYKFYQVVGLIIFPDVVDYQTQNYKQDFKLFYLNLNQSEVYSSSRVTYKKLGLCNSFLVNTQGIIIKYLVFSIALLIIKFLTSYQKFLANSKLIRKFDSLNQTVKKLINSENDTNLLMIFQSILVQFVTFDQQIWAVRYGYYMAITFLIQFLVSLYYNFQEHLKCNEGANQFLCFQGLFSTPCNQSLNPDQQLCKGTNIFQSYSNPTITKFAITGWFIMKGMLNQQYNMITVYENQSTLLFSISYNINQNTFTSQLLSGASQNLNYVSGGVYPLQQKWYFARFKMEIILGTQVNLYSNIYESQSSYFYLQQNTAIRNSIPIQTSGMVFDFGKGISQQSCTLLKLVYVYWESDLLDTSMFGLINDVTVSNINLKCIYDTFYTKNNPEYLVQVNQPNGKSQIPINRSEQLTLKNQEQIYTESINLRSNGGFVLTFHFKIESQNVSANQIIIMQINGIDLMAQNNQLYFYNNLISGVQLNKWNQITIIYRQLFYNQINFIVNDDQATYRSFSLGSYMYQFVQAIFGDSMITDYFLRLNYIRIYEGLFLSNSPSCYMLAARQNQSCVICKSSYLIDYQNGINCVSPSSTIKSTIIDNVKDWFPKQVECPKNMILNNQNICVCMYHFYRNGDDCLPCQSYCQGCLDASTCIQKDPQRDSSGQCPNNQFDDGFQCLAPVFNLKSRKNILKTFAVNDFGDMCINVGANSDYIIPQSQLNLAKGVGFFFSFSVIIRQPHTQRTIAVLNDGPADLFTILFDTTTQNGQNLPCIQFYIKSNMKSQVILNSYNEVWIGLWSNFINAQYFVYADQFFYQQLDQNTQLSAITLNSPQLCIGKCNSILQSNYVCAQYSQIFFTLRIAYSNYSQIQNLMQQITAQIALFQIDFNNLPISNTLMDSISTKELKQNLNYNLNRYKGAQFTQYINEACIKNINLMENIPTISFYIFIERLSQQKLIVSIQLTSTENIQYFIVPYGNKFLVRICQGFACQDTQYAMLNQNQQNFLYIIQRARQTSQTNIILEFEVFCNYQRESLTFIIQKQTYQIPTDINIFPKESSLYAQDYSIYLNKIRFEVGNGSYYYDQNKSDNCFLYRNVSDMECMIPKQGYVFYQNNILITIEACKQRTQLYNSYHVINPSTQTCIDTQLSPYCQQVDEVQQNLVCSKCLYPGQNPIKNCQCDDGQFLNNQDLVCQNCSPRCKTCVNQYDNCLSCYQIDQYPPNCDCNLSNYFVNKNNQCQACSYMCNTCKSSSEFCLTCSNNRIDPPDCNCKENYIEINNRCQVQTCDLKCLACHSLTSNCVTCKNGRENPPICNCKTNFIENIDGTCTLCNFGDYYDNNTKSCQQCDIECLGCTEQASNCLACRSSLIQTKNKCSCQSGTSLAKIKNEFLCLKNMEVILTISLQSNSYILLFKFDEDIQQLDSKYLQNIEILIKVTFSEISLNAYKIGNPIINKNTLSVQLIVNTSFSTQKGWVLFLDNTQFISVSQQYMLNKIYTVNLINFQIGPFVFDRNTLDSGQLDKINDYYKNTNQNIFNLLKQFQIILYLLNSAQPTVLFLLLDAKLPPNLYKFYQVVGLIIFPDVVDYQTQNYKQDFKLFYLNLNQSEVYSSSRVTYKKLGLCNSFLVNTQGIIIKYLVFSIVLLIVKFLTSNQKFLINSQFERKMNSLNQTVKKLINSENDTNLLMIFQSILVQFITFDQQLWAVRYGYYLAVTFLIIFLASFYNNFQE
ncbi:hypothetical protein ABPG74_018415, partial [Tetrahymena malaccensis]